MRPAVYASVVRNRKQNARRIQLRAPQFAVKRLMVMVFLGGALFIPGLILTILGIKNEEDVKRYSPAHKVLYTVIGPTALALGVIILMASVLYYFCYGIAGPTRNASRHPSSASSASHHGSHSGGYSSVRSAHSHDEKHANGELRHSRHSHKRNTSGSSHGSHHHQHQHNHSHSNHSTSPPSHCQRHNSESRSHTGHTHKVDDKDQPSRLTEKEDVTVTLETGHPCDYNIEDSVEIES